MIEVLKVTKIIATAILICTLAGPSFAQNSFYHGKNLAVIVGTETQVVPEVCGRGRFFQFSKTTSPATPP